MIRRGRPPIESECVGEIGNGSREIAGLAARCSAIYVRLDKAWPQIDRLRVVLERPLQIALDCLYHAAIVKGLGIAGVDAERAIPIRHGAGVVTLRVQRAASGKPRYCETRFDHHRTFRVNERTVIVARRTARGAAYDMRIDMRGRE